MADPVSIRSVFDLPPERAIAFLDSKGYRTSIDWTDTFDAEHDASFTVAKIAKVDLLRTIHVSLLDAMAEGKTFATWQAELQPELERAGWWGTRIVDPDLTGTTDPVTIGPRRLRTIYDTNLRMARSAALWERVQAQKATLPFLRYSAVLDRRTRPAHRAWHGTILPVDHPWWQTHFPPCGWNCRCTVIQLSQAMMDGRGMTVSDAPPPGGLVPFFRKATGQTLQVPSGIDPGFGYNPGIARMQAVADKVAGSLVEAKRAGLAIDDDAALAEILADLGGVRPDGEALAGLRALIAAGEVAQLAAAIIELMG
jgi:SPP1 gp7 family putative phage head morphogenesis protein